MNKLLSHVVASLFVVFGLLTLQVSAQYNASTDFLIADSVGGRIAVYDQNLVFQRYLDTVFAGVSGLTLLSPNSVAAAGTNRIKTYNSLGATLTDFTDVRIGNARDMKSIGTTRLFVGTRNVTNAVAEFSNSGTYVRSYGSKAYTAVAVLPGGVLWASEIGSSTIDVFDIATGTQTSTITLDGGEINADSMFYSPSTNTVLITDFNTIAAYERSSTGSLIRTFAGGNARLGVTRGPGGDVFATDGAVVDRWTSAGAYVGATDISANVGSANNIVWAGNFAPSAASVGVSGRVVNSSGYGISRAAVILTSGDGTAQTTTTNPFGYFKFDTVSAGQSYGVEIRHKQYAFVSQLLTVTDEISDLIFTSSK